MTLRSATAQMATDTRRSLAANLALAALLLPAAAHADDGPQPGVSVRVEGIPAGTSVRIERPGADEIVVDCVDACSTVLDPGRYRLRLRNAAGETIDTQTANVTRPVVFHPTGADPARAVTGLVLGIAGSALVVSAVVSLGIGFMCDDNCGPAAIYGLAGLVTGAIMTPIGWVMFAHNRRPFRPEILKGEEAASPPAIQLGIVPRLGGGAGVLTVTF